MTRPPALSALLALLLAPLVTAGEEPSLDQRLEALTAALEEARIEAHVPGMSIAVVQDDRIVYARGFGLADVEAGRAADAETIYAVGSTTKAFTATLAGMLVDEGKMEWDSPVTDFLPYFDLKVRSQDPDAACTMRDLLSHRHGFSRMSLLWLSEAVTREDVLRTAAGAEPFDDFRAGFHYCNVTYLAAGEAIGAADGSTWDELMVERILEPLEMGSTTLTMRAAEKDPRLAVGYRYGAHDGQHDRERRAELERIGPAGSVNSNVLDMAQWVRLLLGRGEVDGKRLISAERLEDTWRPQVRIADGVAYGLGWMLRSYDGREVVEHGGNINGYSAQVTLVPSERTGYVLLTNLSVAPIQQGSIPVVLDALFDEWPDEGEDLADGEELDLDEYAGTYVARFATFDDEEFEVRVKEGGIALHIPSQTTFDLKQPDAEGKWYFAMTSEVAVTFERDETGAVVGLALHQGGYRFEVPRKGRVLAPDATDEELAFYTGVYDHTEKDRHLEIRAEDGRLAVLDEGRFMPLLLPDSDGNANLRSRDDQGVTFHVEDGVVVALTFHGGNGDVRFLRRAGEGDDELPSVEAVLALRGTEARVEALRAAGAMRLTGRMLVPQAGLEGEMTVLLGGPRRHADHMDFGRFGSVDLVANAEQAWSFNGLTGLQELEGQELAQARLGHIGATEGDWREYFERIRVLRNDELDGRRVHVLRLEREDLPGRTYWVDAETGDLLRMDHTMVQGSVRIPATVTYEDFREEAGLRLAGRSTSENPASGRTVFVLERVETGVDVSDADFRLEETRED